MIKNNHSNQKSSGELAHCVNIMFIYFSKDRFIAPPENIRECLFLSFEQYSPTHGRNSCISHYLIKRFSVFAIM